jgi:YesN/AraC family two-component response regulator
MLMTEGGTRYKALIIPSGTTVDDRLKALITPLSSYIIYGEDVAAMARYAKAEPLRTDLKLQDVAVCLHTNSSYVSECINSVCGQTFSQFVNEFRVRHAMELLRQQPDMKIVAITSASGFSTEASFFRNFKTVTGMTPREWVASL